MATSASAVLTGTHKKAWDVTFTADADTTLLIPHGFPSTPMDVVIAPKLGEAYTNTIHVSAVDGTNITVTGVNAVGSSSANPQAIVYASVPHSLGS